MYTVLDCQKNVDNDLKLRRSICPWDVWDTLYTCIVVRLSEECMNEWLNVFNVELPALDIKKPIVLDIYFTVQ